MEKTNLGLVAWVKARVGWPYWYGCVCLLCTEKLLLRKAEQFPEHYAESRMPKYRNDIEKGLTCTDCSGLIKGYWWDDGGKRVTGLDGRPDTNANGIYRRAKVKGGIRTLPETPGVILWHDGHVGVYIGGGELIEAKGFDYGVVKSKVSKRNFTNWCLDPYITYLDSAGNASDGALGDRSLLRGDTGADVTALQMLLVKLGYDLPAYGADGDFGTETESAVKRFQAATELEPSGVVDTDTLNALLAAGEGDIPADGDGDALGETILVTGSSVFIRNGPGVEYGKAGVAHQGDKLVRVEAGGWVPVVVDGIVRWISGKYVE